MASNFGGDSFFSSASVSTNDNSNTTTPSSKEHQPHSHVKRKPKKLTIENKSKIEEELEKGRDYRHRPSLAVVLIKWLATFILGALLLACVIESKVSVLTLSSHMSSSNSVTKRDKIFVMLFLLALIPHVINFLRGIWKGAFRKDIPWPGKRALITGTVISLFESAGLCLFIFKLPLICKPNNIILLMNGVFLLTIVYNLVRELKKKGDRSPLYTAAMFIAFVLEIAGLAITGFLMKDGPDRSDLWAIPVGVFCLSVAWLPSVQKYLVKHNKDEILGPERNEDFTPDETIDPHSSTYQKTNEENIDTLRVSIQMDNVPNDDGAKSSEKTWETRFKRERSTWKLTIIMSFMKIIFTVAISLLLFLYNLFDAKPVLNQFWNGWSDWRELDRSEVYYFVANGASSIIGYLVGYISCTTCMQRWAFTVPLFLASPVAMGILSIPSICNQLLVFPGDGICDSKDIWYWLLIAALCLILAQGLSVGLVLFRSHSLIMQKESQLFWVPMYNNVLLDQWLMLIRRNEQSDEEHENPLEKAKRSKIIICTTMYREADYEMKQILESIQGINLAQGDGQRHFESHIFFDGAVKDKNPTEFVLQLVALVESTLDVEAHMCSKTSTPYGMTLSWRLNAERGKTGMIFKIHLKDNLKVKNKKRWSQVMYMSYVLDFLMEHLDNATPEETYILTTDADVKFTPDSVEALLDLMTRDHSVGAVCARTYPLGSGPVVWYQVFEYAIGHWFQKAAEHVIGSVLCSPGCFSVYRCRALQDILPQYATNVEHAFDFLTKDMGEDRWLCTLMVQSGWRIEYCAASDNSTHCPEEFDEFYKQRRRWVASTLANLMLLIKEWNIISKLNPRVSFVFLIYQAILLFATLIGPSSVILVVSGGLVYGWGIDSLSSIIVQMLIIVAFSLTCLFTSSKTQLGVAKLLTFLYAIVMTAVIVGTAIQVVSDFSATTPNPDVNATTTPRSSNISADLTVSTTTVYLAVMVSLFLITGLFHLREFVCLMHGIWYLLCLPSGYLVLMVYSICNITDRSWGTREEKKSSVVNRKESWQIQLKNGFQSIFFCCFSADPEVVSVGTQIESHHLRRGRQGSTSEISEPGINIPDNVSMHGSLRDDQKHDTVDGNLSAIHESREDERQVYIESDDEEEDLDPDTVIQVADWLPKDMRGLASNFIENGFEDTRLISGMTEKELKDIGIKRKGAKRHLIEEIKKLPDYDIQADVPDSVDTWLNMVGLPQYIKNFKREQIKTSKDMEVLKSFGRSEIEKELKITKPGHIKRLLYAIRRLRNPTESERKMLDVKKSLDLCTRHYLKNINKDEYNFWNVLKEKCLMPQSTAYGLEEDLKNKLGDLRNTWLMIFAVSNMLWLILIGTLANKGQLLTIFGSNPVGLVVLVLFSFVLLIQFLAMIVHRIATLTHFLGRAPYKITDTFNTSWAFNDSDMKSTETLDIYDIDAEHDKRKANKRADARLKHPKSKKEAQEEKQPLLSN